LQVSAVNFVWVFIQGQVLFFCISLSKVTSSSQGFFFFLSGGLSFLQAKEPEMVESPLPHGWSFAHDLDHREQVSLGFKVS
jgi:hypothetical protein